MNSKHIPYSLHHLAGILLLLICGTIGATAQELREDSIFADTEMEDSLSSLAIKPVENPKKLLKQCLKQLKNDLQQKHSKREYQLKEIEHDTTVHQTLVASQVLTIESDNGITLDGIYSRTKWSPLHIEAPSPLSSEDSSHIEFDLSYCCIPKFRQVKYSSAVSGYEEEIVSRPIYSYLMVHYDIEAYSIGNDSGRGVYRIDLVQKKINERSRSPLSSIIRLYFDMSSLRLIQYRYSSFTPPGLRGYSLDSRPIIIQPPGLVFNYRYNYEEENGSPVLTNGQLVITAGKKILSRFFIQQIKDK